MGVCERFGKLPSEVLAEDVELMQLLKIEELGRGEGPNG